MPPLKIRRIDCREPKAGKQLADLRKQLIAGQDIVTPKNRELTKKVFGEALTPLRAVERICQDVRDKGVEAVLKYTEQFDKVKVTKAMLRVPVEELRAAHAAAEPEYLETLRNIRQNILSFQMGLLNSDAVMTVSGSHELQVRYRPLRRIGAHIPGGAASYPSSLLMTVCPAQAAGVKEIAVVMPPTAFGTGNLDMLASCHELGVSEVYRMGGAQSIAALAYGVEGVEPVDMIVGPGNQYVTLAKRLVFGTVAIDCLAGPSEVVVLADESAQPEFIAADMIAQAEHAPGVSILVAWSAELVDEVAAALDRQLAKTSRGDLARDCLERYGAFILASSKDEAVQITGSLAPEHLHIQTRDPESLADRIDHAGAIFLGHYTPVALGDYAAGPSHVLPTGGTARFASGLCSNDFQRRSTILAFTQRGMKHIAEDVTRLAGREGLDGHAASVQIRMNGATARPPKKKVAASATPAATPPAPAPEKK